MINLILLFFLVSSVSSQRSSSRLCYPFVQQDCPLGQRCEQGICQRETDACQGYCVYYPGSICEYGRCVWPPGARCNGRGNLPCSSGYVCRRGICRRDSTECRSDFDCPDLHRPHCVNGRCQLATEICSVQNLCRYHPGTLCENDQCVWPPGARCDRIDFIPCSSGYVCRNRICRRAVDTCLRNCRDYPGSICENGRCVLPPGAKCERIDYLPCSSGYVCRNGFCERDRECTSDSICPDSHRYECVNGKCELYTSCRSIFDCSGVQRCHRRRCREPCGISGICQKPGFKCESGVCVPIQDGPIFPTSSPTPTAPSGIGCRNNLECPPGQECIRIGSQRQCVFVIS